MGCLMASIRPSDSEGSRPQTNESPPAGGSETSFSSEKQGACESPYRTPGRKQSPDLQPGGEGRGFIGMALLIILGLLFAVICQGVSR
jgi:hypothetical protein